MWYLCHMYCRGLLCIIVYHVTAYFVCCVLLRITVFNIIVYNSVFHFPLTHLLALANMLLTMAKNCIILSSR